MQTHHVNGYDMAYLEVGEGRPLVCVHGTLGDFRTWYSVLGPLSKKHRVIAVSLRHLFPEHWNGIGGGYQMSQHIADTIALIEQIGHGPVDLMGHSRGGRAALFAGSRLASTVPPGSTRTSLRNRSGRACATRNARCPPRE